MVGANAVRAVLTAVLALAVLARHDVIAAPDDIEQVVGTEWFLYVAIIVATLLLGTCEVLYDNSAQTFMPAIVDPQHLERANGRMYSAEIVANQFLGPPLASILLLTGFVLPVVFDAATFAVSAGLVFASWPRNGPLRRRTPSSGAVPSRRRWPRGSAGSGTTTCCGRSPSRSAPSTCSAACPLAVVVLLAQEVLHTSTLEFGLFSTGAAIGGVARRVAGVRGHEAHWLRCVRRVDAVAGRRRVRRDGPGVELGGRCAADGRLHVRRRSSGT